MADPFLGQIMQVAFNYAPTDWALCNGQLLPVSQNQALFALISNMYGGDGVSNFGLPNLIGRTVIGADLTAQKGTPLYLGNPGGATTQTLTEAQLAVHNHEAIFVPTPGPNPGPVKVAVTLSALTDPVGTLAAAPSNGAMLSTVADPDIGGAPVIYAPTGVTGTSVNLGGINVATSGGGGAGIVGGTVGIYAAGGNEPVSIMQPYLPLTTIICLSGIWPPKP